MSASITDLLTTQKNGVVGINRLAQQGAVATLFGRGPMATSYASIYASPSSGRSIVTDIDVCNTAGAPATVYISLVPLNGSPGAGNALFYAASVAANSVLQWRGAQVLGPGDTIQAYASATTCTLFVSGGVGV